MGDTQVQQLSGNEDIFPFVFQDTGVAMTLEQGENYYNNVN